MRQAAPIGLVLGQTSKVVARAFGDALEAAGGSLPVWLVLLALADKAHETQGEIAHTVGIRGPTLTHHLDRMARDGLICRTRPAENRRVQHLALTEAGLALFLRLREAAVAFDAKLRKGMAQPEIDRLRALLARLVANVENEREP